MSCVALVKLLDELDHFSPDFLQSTNYFSSINYVFHQDQIKQFICEEFLTNLHDQSGNAIKQLELHFLETILSLLLEIYRDSSSKFWKEVNQKQLFSFIYYTTVTFYLNQKELEDFYFLFCKPKMIIYCFETFSIVFEGIEKQRLAKNADSFYHPTEEDLDFIINNYIHKTATTTNSCHHYGKGKKFVLFSSILFLCSVTATFLLTLLTSIRPKRSP